MHKVRGENRNGKKRRLFDIVAAAFGLIIDKNQQSKGKNLHFSQSYINMTNEENGWNERGKKSMASRKITSYSNSVYVNIGHTKPE